MTSLSLASLLALSCLMLSSATLINLENRCPYAVTAFARHGSSSTNSYNLAANNGYQQLNVGSSWVAGLVWASTTGNTNNGQATQLEMTTNPPNEPGVDTYDISLVNAYNLPAAIQPIGVTANGQECGAPTCTINNLQSFCTSPDTYSNSGPYCINTDGPGTVSTSSTQKFKAACPDAYSYSKDDASSTYSCKTGTNYNFVFCP